MVAQVFTRRQQFDEWIERRAVDYIQPDVTKCGGLSEEYKIAMHAYERAILFVPHGWNTAVGLAADLQLVGAVPVARWVEYITPAPYIEDLVSGEAATSTFARLAARICAFYIAVLFQSHSVQLFDGALGEPFAIDEEGMITIPTGPGLGISWSDAGIEKHTGLQISSQVTGVVEPPTRQVLPSGTSGFSYAGSCKQRQRL